MSERQRNRLRVELVLIVACVLLGLLVALMDAHKAARLLGHAAWRWLPAGLIATAASYVCLSAGYATINRIFEISIRNRDLLEIGFISHALNNLVSMAGVVGYSLRFVLLRRRGVQAGDILGASLVHSYLNYLAMMTLLPVGLLYVLLNHSIGRMRSLEMTVATALAAGALIGTTWLSLNAGARARCAALLRRIGGTVLRRDIGIQLSDLDARIGRAVSAVRDRPSVLGLPLVLVLADWAASVLALGACFSALGAPLHVGILVTGFAVGVIAGSLSMLPGGLGVQEGSMAGVYVLLGVDYERAMLAAMFFRFLYYVVPFGVSLTLYTRMLRATPSPMGSMTPGSP